MPVNRAGRVVRCPRCKTAMCVAPVFPSERTVVDEQKFSGSTGEPAPFVDHVRAGSVADFKTDHLAERASRARSDRVLMSRFFGLLLLVVAGINAAPAIYNWYLWSMESLAGDLPRWTYLQIFVAALHVIYAIFVFQVADWSTLKAVSAVLLVVAAIFGFVSVSLTLAGGNSAVAAFLGLPTAMMRNAMIWCIAMLLLTIISSYLSGREALNWQRVDRIFEHLVLQNPPG